MVKEKILLNSKKYKFKHLQIDVVERDGKNNVLVFRATYVKTALPNQLISDGLREINKTLWDQESGKRPKGYWVLGGYNGEDGISTSYLVAEEWVNGKSLEYREQKRKEWKIGQ